MACSSGGSCEVSPKKKEKKKIKIKVKEVFN
jgi:hypothetical protein